MRSISRIEVQTVFDQHTAAGCHVDDRLLAQIDAPGELFVDVLPTCADYLRLVWQSIDAARPLVPVERPRTLRDCASRLESFEWRFQALVAQGYPWFEKCARLDQAFDWSKLGWIAVTPLLHAESRSNPQGSYYIYDGAHKSIVLAKRLLCRELEYRPVEVLLLTPRRH